MSDLLPCPFCGRTDIRIKIPTNDHLQRTFACCAYCGGRTLHQIWNTRAELAAHEQGWISVQDRLPLVGETVWYYFSDRGVYAGHYHGVIDGLTVFGGKSGFLSGDVTDWMPRDINPPIPPAPDVEE